MSLTFVGLHASRRRRRRRRRTPIAPLRRPPLPSHSPLLCTWASTVNNGAKNAEGGRGGAGRNTDCDMEDPLTHFFFNAAAAPPSILRGQSSSCKGVYKSCPNYELAAESGGLGENRCCAFARQPCTGQINRNSTLSPIREYIIHDMRLSSRGVLPCIR